MRKAVQDLVKGGMLVQRHGSGTFVAPRMERVEQSLSRLTSFTEDMARRGMTVRSQWLDRGLYAPSPDEMMVLGLSSNELVARVGRLRIADDTPLAIERASLSAQRAARSRRRSAPRSTRRWRRPAIGRCGPCSASRPPISARPTRACSKCRRARPACNIERISYLASGKVIEFTRSIYRGDAYDFVAELRLAGPTRRRRQAHDRNDHPYAARDRGDPGGRRAAARRVRAPCLPRPARGIRERDPRFLVTVARGSSDHAATFLKYAVELTAGLAVASVGPSIASIYGARLRLDGSACLAISQSGKSPDIVAMAEAARGRRRADHRAHQHRRLAAGARLATMRSTSWPGRNAASRRPSPSSIPPSPALPLMAHCTGDDALLAALGRLPEHFAQGGRLRLDGDGRRACRRASSLFILGRGPSVAIASEAALKFKETCAMHAEAYSAAEVMHGPLALVGPGFPVLALAARDASEASVAEAADGLAAKGAPVFVTSDARPSAPRACPCRHRPSADRSAGADRLLLRASSRPSRAIAASTPTSRAICAR